ncbi:hypothetical protein Sango_1400500 [Sesamum angolense]|uniref:Uncharacterized protein n=1 Tax=Sesamum angolense TaxID=2727404 RepID=A0AAE1WTG6_9LAMI|nr:hypothetical protein Sango_1400500 [Sesamum angolense]
MLEAHVLIFNKNLDEAFFMMKFISGLKEEIKGYVATMKPTTLDQAIVLARKQENMVNAIVRKTNQHQKTNQGKPIFKPPNKGPPYKPSFKPSFRYREENPQPKRFLTEAEAKTYEEGEEQIEDSPEDEDATVSFHAMGGNNSNKTLRINGKVNGKDIHILIDSGSTHCFIDEKVVQVLGCTLEQTTPMAVRIADGGE